MAWHSAHRVYVPLATEAHLRELRHRYNAALTAYRSCALALTAQVSGIDSQALRDRAAKAKRALDDARARLSAALSRTNGGSASEAGGES
jgi:hypothetical protein